MKREDIKDLPSLEVLRHLFVYEPDTGVLLWRVRPHVMAKRSAPGSEAGTVGAHGYRVVKVGEKYYYVHRIIWKIQTSADPVDQIDHIDGVRSNNKWVNLREADNGKNRWNIGLQKNNKSGVKGVFREHGIGPWVAVISVNKRQIRLGRFSSFDAAVAVRRNAEAEMHGEFARIAGVVDGAL